jgi:hypothetical protein
MTNRSVLALIVAILLCAPFPTVAVEVIDVAFDTSNFCFFTLTTAGEVHRSWGPGSPWVLVDTVVGAFEFAIIDIDGNGSLLYVISVQGDSLMIAGVHPDSLDDPFQFGVLCSDSPVRSVRVSPHPTGDAHWTSLHDDGTICADGDTIPGPDSFTPVQPLAPGSARASLIGNHPNPFNSGTIITYRIDVSMAVSIEIFDSAGTLTAILAEGERGPGVHKARWNGCDLSNRPAASGIYFCRIDDAGESPSHKMILIK